MADNDNNVNERLRGSGRTRGAEDSSPGAGAVFVGGDVGVGGDDREQTPSYHRGGGGGDLVGPIIGEPKRSQGDDDDGGDDFGPTTDKQETGRTTRTATTTSRRKRKCGFYRAVCFHDKCRNALFAWPRTSSLAMGIVVPLFVVIFVAVFFGYFLARIEAPTQVRGNDALMATAARDTVLSVAALATTRNMPRTCYQLYFDSNGTSDILLGNNNNNESDSDKLIIEALLDNVERYRDAFLFLLPRLNDGNNNGSNVTERDHILLYEFRPNGNDGKNDDGKNDKNNYYLYPSRNISIYLAQQDLEQIGGGVGGANGSTDPSPGGDDPLVLINVTDFYEWMETCVGKATTFIERLFGRIDGGACGSQLKFDWIRCFPGASGINSPRFPTRNVPIEDLRPNGQAQLYAQTWKQNQRELYHRYFQQLNSSSTSSSGTTNATTTTTNLTERQASFLALNMSIDDATGGTTCQLNAAAAGWFWFVTMTTLGYGNVVPSTEPGRAMVYTLGFLSIMIFGALVARAGAITSRLADDAMVRVRLRCLTVPWLSCLSWGTLYYAWMAVTAAVTIWWKQNRLGDETFG